MSEETKREKGRAIIAVGTARLAEMLTPGEHHYVVRSDAPADAEPRFGFWSVSHDAFWLSVESDEIAPMPEGAELRIFVPEIEAVGDEAAEIEKLLARVAELEAEQIALGHNYDITRGEEERLKEENQRLRDRVTELEKVGTA